MKTWEIVLFWLLNFLTAAGRFTIPGHGLSWPGTYEAFAHLWIGALLGIWYVQRKAVFLWVVGILTVLEVVMFLLR